MMDTYNASSPVQARFAQATGVVYDDRTVKRLIYLYIFFLFFEGALRKWILPGLSTPLILVRDPLALLIIFQYVVSGRRLFNPYTLAMLGVGILSFMFTMVAGHGNLYVGIYGVRTIALHFFLVFIIGNVFNRADVERLGRWLLVAVIPITVLIALQFYSPQINWVNRGVGGDISGSGFGGSMGYFRPSGIFSFTNGNTLFYGLVTAFVAYYWNNRKNVSKIFLILATAGVLITVPLSISRTYVFHIVLTVAFLLLASLRNGRAFLSLLIPLLSLPLLVLLLSQFEFMQTAMEVMNSRFIEAGRAEGGVSDSIGDRIFGTMIAAVTGGGDNPIPLWGFGIGLGTNIGAVLLSGSRAILLAEAEWLRIVGEMGPIFGLIVVAIRTILCFRVGVFAVRQLRRGNTLPFMLFSFSLPIILIGGWAQPTSLGFFVLAAGLTIASCRSPQWQVAHIVTPTPHRQHS